MAKITEATEQALKHLQDAAPHVEKALKVLCESLGVDDPHDVERNPEDSSKRDRAVVVLLNARSAHLYVTDAEGT